LLLIPRKKFKLVAQQQTVQKRRLDILFGDKYGHFIIIEVKRSILSREASGQVIVYYALLKEQFPEKSIELILCATTIHNERKIFLENVGIECKEVPVSQLVNIAAKYKYTFLDTKKHESEDLDL
jgi:RecB family endonuclease NucS